MDRLQDEKILEAEREALTRRIAELNQPIGVWLDGHENPSLLADSINRFVVIAVNFPKFADGRDYSAAALLRGRYGFKGELRVIGDVLRNLFFYRQRVGFNAFAVRADKVEPLNRALALKKAWLTGLRREQAPSRKDLGESEFDTGHKLTKFNPLIDWWWEAEGKGGQQECGLHVKAVDISGLKSKVGATA